ncbi:MAG: hypothetical protein ACKOAU_07310 [Pirellula sp.]
MSKTKKDAFPSWVLAAMLASCLAVVVLGFLVNQLLAREIAIHREQIRRMSLVESQSGLLPNPNGQSSRGIEASTKDSDTIRRWEGVLAQIKHPYIAAQQTVLAEELPPVLDAVSSVSEEADATQEGSIDPKVVGFQNPVGLARFTLANRPLLDAIYDLVSQSLDDAWFVPSIEYEDLYRIRQLILWDIANCVNSKDKDRLAKAVDGYLRLTNHFGNPNRGNELDALECLLHRGLDEKLIDTKFVAESLERIAKNTAQASSFIDSLQGDLDLEMAHRFFVFRHPFVGGWELPSIKEAAFEEYLYRNNFGANSVVHGHKDLGAALRYFTLALRVALLQAIQEQDGQIRVPQDMLSRLQMPAEIQGVITAKLDGEPLSTLFEYDQKGPGIGVLKFKLPTDISSGPFPIRTTYRIQKD